MTNGKSIFTVFLSLVCYVSIWAQPKVTILDHKDRIRITPVSVLNSAYRETNLSITPNGKYMYFMTVRGQQPWSNQYMEYQGKPIYDGDIWFAKKGAGNVWQKPTCLPYGINTASGEDEPSVSPDGNSVVFQSWKTFWQVEDGPYYMSQLNGTSWGTPKGLGGGITQFFLETGFNATDGMALSPDQKTFIVACGPDYDGKMDLYMSKKKGATWSYLKRLPISTSGDERSAFIAGDGRTIYFASSGYGGLGGLDIFKVEMRSDGTFSEIINIGAPFNTPKDDYGFILTADGKEAYFIRDGDIFFADLTDAVIEIKPTLTIALSGVVKDEVTKKGIPQATVIIIDEKTKKPFKTLKANNSGKFTVSLPNESKSYQITVKAKSYIDDGKSLEVAKSESEQMYKANFDLVKPDVPAAIVVVEHHPEETPQEPEPPVFVKPEYDIVKAKPTPAPYLAYNSNPREVTFDPLKTKEDPFSFQGYATNHLILLLDVSGSMAARDRLPMLRKSFQQMLEYMRPEDRVTIIAYSGGVSVLAENLSADRKDDIVKALKQLTPGGTTKVKQGVKKAYELAKDYYIKGGNNRIIMATDGDFDIDEANTYATKIANENIFFSIFGFGKMGDKKEAELSKLAKKGHGNFELITTENVEAALLKEAKAIKK